jgi:hypothetical protein
MSSDVETAIDTELDARIAEELYVAAMTLGADPIDIQLLPLDAMYEALEALGAPSRLLATVRSWGDGLDDVEVLMMLRTWNDGDRLLLERFTEVH